MQVTIANNGKEAVELAKTTVFDAILMDIQMPEMDGFEVTRIIRSNTSEAQLPIIAMTANAMVGDREKCLDADINDHVSKPIDPKILFETLVKWIPAGERKPVQPTNPLEENAAEKTLLPECLNGIDFEIGLRRIGGNRALYSDLLKDFVKDHGNDCQVIVDAFAQNDIKVAHRIAHTLKGVAGGIGAMALYESAKKVETELKEGKFRIFEPLIEKLGQDLGLVVEDLQKKMKSKSSIDTKNKRAQPVCMEKTTSFLNTLQKKQSIDKAGRILIVDDERYNIKARIRTHIQLKLKTDLLDRMALLDSLTEIPNRRYFDITLEKEIRRAARNGSFLSLVLMDIDFFKKYNDRYGHVAGDACLRRVAKTVEGVLKRASDSIARYGGEEFAIILPGTAMENAICIAEEVRRAVAALNIQHASSDVAKHISISLGVATVLANQKILPLELIEAVDVSLYQAKQNGRNRTFHLYERSLH